MRSTNLATIKLRGTKIDYCLIASKKAHKFRVRVGPRGVEVVQPISRGKKDLDAFFRANENWIINQIDRIKRLGSVRRPQRGRTEIMYRGNTTPVRIKRMSHRRINKVIRENGKVMIITGNRSLIPTAKSLENWLRREAREQINKHLSDILPRIRKSPKKVFVMGQRTKWGNCSPLHNLSFNWRLIMAPDFVLSYIVAHEAMHLVVPDHSNKFWLLLQSISPAVERAKQWLATNGERLLADTESITTHDQSYKTYQQR